MTHARLTHSEERSKWIEGSSAERIHSIGPQLDCDSTIKPLKAALEGPEREIILQALRAFGWNRNETARALDISRSTLYLKMKSYGLLTQVADWPGMPPA